MLMSPNVILIVIDCLRHDYLSCYGSKFVDTPAIDGLAAAGVMFSQAICQAPATTASCASILTGLNPFEHGVRSLVGTKLRKSVITLPSLLKSRDYQTFGIIGASVLDRRCGLDCGFDVYDDQVDEDGIRYIRRDRFFRARRILEVIRKALHCRLTDPACLASVRKEMRHAASDTRGRFSLRRDGHTITRKAIDILRSRDRERPLFLWLHYFDVHGIPLHSNREYARAIGTTFFDDKSRFIVPPPFDVQYKQDPYAGLVAYQDSVIQELVEGLKSTGVLEDSILVLTADHGDFIETVRQPPLRKGGRESSHGYHLYDEAIRVPLIVCGPKYVQGISCVRRQVRSIDILPTITSLCAGGNVGKKMRGVSGKDLFALSDTESVAYSESCLLRAGSKKLYSLRTEEYKLIVSDDVTEKEFYDLRADPGELQDISEKEPRLVARFLRQLVDLGAFQQLGDVAYEFTEEEEEQVLERLRGLGYFE
jgi:arylsulfatase A-like enzyme